MIKETHAQKINHSIHSQYKYVCVHMIYMDMHIWMHVCVCVCCLCVFMYVYVCIYICAFIHVRVCIYYVCVIGWNTLNVT